VLGKTNVGARLPVTLYLPDGKLDAELEVRTLMGASEEGQTCLRAVGGHFHALSASSIQRIEQFLYGSDAQWRVNQYREDSLTPLQRLGFVDKPQVASGGASHWVSCEISTGAKNKINNIVGLAGVRSDKREILVLVHGQLDSNGSFTIHLHGRTGLRTLYATTNEFETIFTGLGCLYLYRMRLHEAPVLAALIHKMPVVQTAMAA